MILIVNVVQGATDGQVERHGRSVSGRERVMLKGPGWKAPAEVGATALVSFSKDVSLPQRFAELGVLGERELLASRRLWLVRDAHGERDGLQLAEALRNEAGIVFVEADYYFSKKPASIAVPPNDPRYSGQWYLKRIGIEGAWAMSTGSARVTIQVIDTGCDLTHPDLAANLLPGLDVIDGDDDPSASLTSSGSSHGTACAGLIAAVGDNGVDIAGTCPECKLRCVRLLDDEATMTPVSADVDAMRFAIDHPDVAVVSNSWGYTVPMPVPAALKMAIEDVSHLGRGGKGALVVFAAGNDNRELGEGEIYSIPEVVTVGATNNFDEAAPFSNHGKEVDLVSPAGTVTLDLHGSAGSTPEDTTSTFGGTSSACPVVAGVAALLFSAKEDATADEVRAALIASVRSAPFAVRDSKGHDPLYGYGIVDPAPALRLLLGLPIPLPEVASVARASDTLGGAAAGCGCRGTDSAVALWPIVVLFVSTFLRRKHHVEP